MFKQKLFRVIEVYTVYFYINLQVFDVFEAFFDVFSAQISILMLTTK